MKRLAPLVVLVAAHCSSSSPPPQKPVVLGTAPFTLTIQGDGTLVLAKNGSPLLVFAADGFQLGIAGDGLADGLAYDPYWLEVSPSGQPPEPPPDLSWHSVKTAHIAKSDSMSCAVDLGFDEGTHATLTIHLDASARFSVVFTPMMNPNIAYVRLRPRADAKEGFYGLGELEDSVDNRGKLRPMQMESDNTTESPDNEAHVPVPLIIGTKGWGLFVESKRVGLFDVARKDPTLVQITYGSPDLRFHLLAADKPLDVTKLYYDITGYPLLPAEWALGPWMWRDENKDQAQVLSDIQQIRTLDLAASGYWFDRPYASHVNSFDWDPSKFTDATIMIQALHDAGFRIAAWSTPYLEDTAQPLRGEADQKKYFPPKPGLALNKWSQPIDFTNPAAYAFWQDNIKKYTTAGVDGFKLDYAEDVVPSLVGSRNRWGFYDGSDDRTMHYGYTLLYHQVYAETLPKTGGYLLCRAGRWGDQKNVSVIWPGDMDATMTKHGEKLADGTVGVGGLPATIIMGLSLGPSGFPFFASDTAGYRHSPPDKETWVRWLEQTALSTVMNVGDSSSQMPWEFTAENGRDQEALDIYKTYARLHVRLFPYEWTFAKAIPVTGRPITRALGFAYPDLGSQPDDAYMFGDDLLVAPIVTKGATSRAVPLPAGSWIDWWTGAVQAGGSTVSIPAPLGTLPLFVRAGAIIPMLRPTIDTMAKATDPNVESFANDAGKLSVRIVPGPDNSFTVYDGTRIDLAGSTIKVASGGVFSKGFALEIIATKMPASVTIDGSPAMFGYDAGVGGTVTVDVPAGAHEVKVQ